MTHNSPGESIGLKFIPSQSELFLFIPISVSEPMRIIPNQSEKRFVSRLMKNGQKSIRLYPINSETSIRMNPNQSETKFSIQINSKQSELGFDPDPIFNQNQSKWIQGRDDSDWLWLKIRFGSIQDRIDLVWKLGFRLVRIKSDWFFTVFHQTRYKTFFGLVRNYSHWLGYRYWNESE